MINSFDIDLIQTHTGTQPYFGGGGASRGCSTGNIQSHLRWGVNVPVSQRTRSRENTTTPYPKLGITRAWERAQTLRRLP